MGLFPIRFDIQLLCQMDTMLEEIESINVFLELVIQSLNLMTMLLRLCGVYERSQNKRKRRREIKYSIISRIPLQIQNLCRIIDISDTACIDNLRMNRNAFGRLCHILQHAGGLEHSRYVMIPEKVARFLSVIAHHKKNRIVGHDYQRSGETVSRHFHEVLRAVIAIHKLLMVVPTPVDATCNIHKWKPFKGCIGALDGTHVNVRVSTTSQPRYRNRKGHITVNVLGVCDRDMHFVYVLAGWEGSAADSRVLKDAIGRNKGLKVPQGSYYLCDSAYTNGDGFLAPYRGIRYHLKEWGDGALAPQNEHEFFNMKHASARNVIERTFGLLKMRWAILKSTSYYPIKIQNRIIMACAILHNFIRKEHSVDPISEVALDTYMALEEVETVDPRIYINVVETTPEWSTKRDTMASEMYNEWRGMRNVRRNIRRR